MVPRSESLSSSQTPRPFLAAIMASKCSFTGFRQIRRRNEEGDDGKRGFAIPESRHISHCLKRAFCSVFSTSADMIQLFVGGGDCRGKKGN